MPRTISQLKFKFARQHRAGRASYEYCVSTDALLDHLGLDGIHTTPSEVGQRSGRSSVRKMSSLFQLPPTPVEGSQRIYNKVASFLGDKYMKVTLDSNEFSRDHTHVGSLSNAALLRIYWFAQGRLETSVGSRLLNLLNNMKVEIVSSRCFSVSVCMFHGNFDCNSDVLFSGICPWGPGVTHD